MEFKSKSKAKLFALLSAIILWLYVTTVIDPLESKTFKGIPVSITTSSEMKENKLEIFPDETVNVDITVKTNLSKLKKITRDSISIVGTIANPVPGRNVVNLSSNLPDSIRHDIEPNTITINLEPTESIKKDVTVIANKKYTTKDYNIKIDKEYIEVSGPKTLINKIDKVIGTIKSTDTEDSFIEKIELIPIDKSGNKVERVKLSDKYISVSIEKVPQEELEPVDGQNPNNTANQSDENTKKEA